MTDIPEAAWKRVVQLENEAGGTLIEASRHFHMGKAFARYIASVSEVAKDVRDSLEAFLGTAGERMKLEQFILTEPVDPLVEALRGGVFDPGEFANHLRGELSKRGFEIRPVQS